MAELAVIRRYRPYPHIYFTDDNMLVNTAFSLELLQEMKGAGIHWMTHSDISLAEKRAVLERLYDSGCRKIVIGFESIVPESLYSLERWKYRKLKNYAGIHSHYPVVRHRRVGDFIVGLDSDDRSVFKGWWILLWKTTCTAR